jgi:hypothetical protein
MISKPKTKTKKRKILKRKGPIKQARKVAKKQESGTKSGPKVQASFHPVPKPGCRNGIKQRSHKQDVRERNLLKLNHYLRKVRAQGMCEIPGCGSSWHLQGAHIVGRAIGGKDNAGNLIEVCGDHHDHVKYSNGLPLDTQQLLNMISEKNKAYGIDRFLTGEAVPAVEEYDW